MKKLTKSNTNRVLCGVCGGLGNYFNLDPILFRLAFVFLPGTIFVYIVMALLIEDGEFT